MENILFKISFPAEFHAQTAVECVLALHPIVKDRIDAIKTIHLDTQEAAVRIINKSGPLHNPANRDHCLQYMLAIGLLHGELAANHYEDECAADPHIDALRDKMHVTENTQFSKDYLDPIKRSISNAIQIEFDDGSKTDKITIEYPIGHHHQREEGIPLLKTKFVNSLEGRFSKEKSDKIVALFEDSATFDAMSVSDFVGKF